MKKLLKKIGTGAKWLYQRKRNIGIGILLLTTGVQAYFPDAVTPERIRFWELVGGGVAGLGWLENMGKNSETVNRAIKKAQKITIKK